MLFMFFSTFRSSLFFSSFHYLLFFLLNIYTLLILFCSYYPPFPISFLLILLIISSTQSPLPNLLLFSFSFSFSFTITTIIFITIILFFLLLSNSAIEILLREVILFLVSWKNNIQHWTKVSDAKFERQINKEGAAERRETSKWLMSIQLLWGMF